MKILSSGYFSPQKVANKIPNNKTQFSNTSQITMTEIQNFFEDEDEIEDDLTPQLIIQFPYLLICLLSPVLCHLLSVLCHLSSVFCSLW